ncbi:MAG: ABC transporter substrate-binding protein [Dehalococcoidales bacterium]|nr:ABC transporter substrate-binding protein [Dehalococcoidales bacterium]
MKRWFLVPLFLLLAAVMVVTSCGGDETTPATTTPTTTQPTTTEPTTTEPTTTEPTPTVTTPEPIVPTGTLTAVTADFGFASTDPIFFESLWGWSWSDSLLRWDENNNFIPGVAYDWNFDEATCTWTFYITEGIKFHNGEDLTAEDVKFSVDRFGADPPWISLNPWSQYISYAYNKADSIVVDDYTYQFVAEYPEACQQVVFAWTRILPKDYFDEVGQDGFRAFPIGSGPWKFKELIPNTSITLEANADYWRPDEIPYYQYYVELMVPEQATRINMLRTGECDIALGVDYDRIPELRSQGYATVNAGVAGTSSISFQGTWFPSAGATGNINVRKAMSYALDRQEIADTWYDGFAKPGGQWYMVEGCFGWTDELTPDPYDPGLATQLLEAAGYPDAFDDPVIHIYTTAAGQDYHLLLISYWEAIGLQVQLEIVDSTISTAYIFHNFAGRIEETDPNVGWIFSWTYNSYFNSTYHCANLYTSRGIHGSGNDPVADAMYNDVTHTADIEEADRLFAEFQLYVKTLYINIGIVEFDILTVYNPATVGDWTGRNWVSYQDALNGIKHPGQ